MRKWGIRLVIIASLIGLSLSALALKQHVTLLRVGMEQPSFCNISETLNCDIVAASSYATVWGLPVAGFGLIFFALQFLFAGWALFQAGASRVTSACGFVLALLATIPSGYLVFVMVQVLGTYCLSCLGMDVATLAILFGWFVNDGAKWSALRDRSALVRHAATIAVVGGVGLLFLYNLKTATAGAHPPQAMLDELVRGFARQSSVEIPVDPAVQPVWGAPDAKVTVVEFSDFECPYCARAAFTLRPYLAEFRRDVRFAFFHYPLDSSCNQYLPRAMHQQACLAARAAVCAHQQGQFWEYHDDLFRAQKELSRESIVRIAAQHGMTGDAFTQCLDAPATDRIVRDQIEIANRLKLSGTPTVYINGRLLKQWQHPDFLRAAIRAALAESSPSR